MKRGELWTAVGTGYSSKPRPVLIIQSDLFYNTDSVTVVLITSRNTNAPLLRIEIPATKETGLQVPSFVMVDKTMTLRRANVADRIGVVPQSVLTAVERSLASFLGIL